MEAAAGTAVADYQGYGKFWNLPLAKLREFELYGVPMMRADEAGALPGAERLAGACCGAKAEHCGTGTAVPAGSPGLVRGLRGEAPFDGSQFPRLPWGGRTVAEPDIRFIEGWIGDGCPAREEDADRGAAAAAATHLQALATGQAPHPAFAGPVNQWAAEAGRPKVRKNIKYLSEDELRRFRAAVAQMKSLDGYLQDDRSFAYWARIHANQCQHGWEEFLTWHRAYLYGFEKQLQDIDPTVTLPYWDWAADWINVQKSMEDMAADDKHPLDNGWVPPAYQCWLDEGGLAKLTAGGKVPRETLDDLRKILGRCESSGARLFKDAGIAYGATPEADRAIIAALEAINPLWTWRRWPGGNKTLIFEAYPTPQDVERILGIADFFRFGSGPMDDQFFGALENVHNLIHNFSGGANPYWTETASHTEFQYGDMEDAGRTAFDPIFWGHHSNVDRLWAEWQQRFVGRGPDNPAAILPPWKFTVADTYSIHRLGYEYAMASHVFPTNHAHGVQRFMSAPTAIHPGVLAGHCRAEIRLHDVQFVPRAGFYIRAFLNTPDASIATPTRGNPQYVGQMNMFTGLCVGGPGHCEVPAGPADRFDHRPRHHKTPSSFRMDATDAVAALVRTGTTVLQVNLAVLNLDGSPAADSLKLDAVALNFFD